MWNSQGKICQLQRPIVNPISHWFSSQWKRFSTVVFQYLIRYTILHVVCASTWLLAPFMQHFHNNCTMDDFKHPMEIQSFILQNKLQPLGVEQFCWIVKILGIKLFPNTFTMLCWNKQLLSSWHFFLCLLMHVWGSCKGKIITANTPINVRQKSLEIRYKRK